jgi:hypothetical protein
VAQPRMSGRPEEEERCDEARTEAWSSSMITNNLLGLPKEPRA